MNRTMDTWMWILLCVALAAWLAAVLVMTWMTLD